MMTQQLEISVLAAPLSAIDRRALSQAWYSALNLARDVTPSTPRTDVGVAAKSLSQKLSRPVPAGRIGRSASPRVPTPPALGTARPVVAEIASRQRGRLVVPLARQIERRFLGAPLAVKRATFSIGNGGARVHVVLQTTGSSAILIALCRPQMREIVARALAEARRVLAARGIVVELAAKGLHRCS